MKSDISILCDWLNLHLWSRWGEPKEATYIDRKRLVQQRICGRCGIEEKRIA